MKIEIIERPACPAARIHLEQGEEVTAEVGAMIAMSQGIQVETTTRSRGSSGGILKGLKRMLSGENFFLNHFKANASKQELVIGPALVGDITHHRLETGTLTVQGSSWLASSTGIDMDMSWQGLGAAVFAKESAFWIKCSGRGDILLNSFGAIYEIDVKEQYTVDTGHIVAFEDTLSFSIGKASSGLISSFLSGEGLVCHFTGQGKLYCQTHHPPNFGRALGPKLKPREQ